MTPAGQDDVHLCKNGHAFTHSVRLNIDDTDDTHFTGATGLPGPSLCTSTAPLWGHSERRPVDERLADRASEGAAGTLSADRVLTNEVPGAQSRAELGNHGEAGRACDFLLQVYMSTKGLRPFSSPAFPASVFSWLRSFCQPPAPGAHA